MANRAFSRRFCSFVHVSAYSTNKCLLHNVLFLFVIRIFLVGNVVVPEHACRFLFNRKRCSLPLCCPVLEYFYCIEIYPKYLVHTAKVRNIYCSK
ncbi:hypothetical protein HMPREF9419_2199 [Prevotella nigrescens ATCC 33563]|nr:hypothetical protein HMPREF9419_2199 [Prevotella nigrescens ATCC 33563]